ncbi:non-functional pseudokinase ZED1-like [Prunus avium]|uniref:Non-functional pseudokinase ZED1-like n=1 Tax=Prunus avium TaxID=42229 RepID=A0A6P5TKF3_PRUAV|nr:non-functional pseudokinase ZED1-like [Prunus avium]
MTSKSLATNNFDPSRIIQDDGDCQMFKGVLDNRTIIIRKYIIRENDKDNDEVRSRAIRDIKISRQMSSHKNALKLLGCCLEFPLPALVHENAAKGVLRDDGSLSGANGGQSLLPWKTRLRIAKQLANALTYLHTAFSEPIIHMNLRSTCILLDDDYVPKLSNFSFSVSDSPKQSHVKGDNQIRASGYTDPDYLATGYITQKTDVYSFGVLLLVLLTQRAASSNQAGELDITANPKFHVSDGQTQIQTIVNPKILKEVGEDGHAQQQLQDCLALAVSCIQNQSEARPKMIHVAKELVRIEKSIFP